VNSRTTPQFTACGKVGHYTRDDFALAPVCNFSGDVSPSSYHRGYVDLPAGALFYHR
jgi:hypothetical protein